MKKSLQRVESEISDWVDLRGFEFFGLLINLDLLIIINLTEW